MCPTCHYDFLPAWQAQVRADSRLPPCGETMQHHAQRGQPASYPLYLLNPEQALLAPDCKLHEVKDCFACPSLVLEKIKPFKSLSFIMNTFYIFLMLQFCIFCGWVGGHLSATTVVYGGQRRACGSQFYLPTMWVLDTQLGLSDLAFYPLSNLLSNEDHRDSSTHLMASWGLRGI